MKRALAVILVLAAFLPAASLLAAAFDCGMPCCHRGAEPAKVTADCCRPAITSDAQPAPPAKSTVTAIAAVSIEVTPVETSLVSQNRFEVRDTAPPRPVRLRLATLATLLI